MDVNKYKKLFVILYTEDKKDSNKIKISKVFTNLEDAKKFLLSKQTKNNKKIPRDDSWKLLVYEILGTSDKFEFSKPETAKAKSSIGVCAHCHLYFERVNNSNFCDKCLEEVKNGKKECDVCRQFFSKDASCFQSNGVVFPSLACKNCTKILIEKMEI
ncbi:hypothetical protein [Spiroplasma endosymbiont of Amphibalanus improvisus]|uniref:hypothetical protein n=1 Tax=Spiroplasma endosymbiont of Amphibalanus improvisus TaxID=3066327 RepID=UPI00313EE417